MRKIICLTTLFIVCSPVLLFAGFREEALSIINERRALYNDRVKLFATLNEQFESMASSPNGFDFIDLFEDIKIADVFLETYYTEFVISLAAFYEPGLRFAVLPLSVDKVIARREALKIKYAEIRNKLAKMTNVDQRSGFEAYLAVSDKEFSIINKCIQFLSRKI